MRPGPRAAAEEPRRRFGAALLALLDEPEHLFGRERVEAGAGVGERERTHALRMGKREVARDPPAHRQADQVGAVLAEKIQGARDIRSEIVEAQRPLVVLGIAVAARIPGRGGEAVAREERELVLPVVAVAADAVQEKDQRPASFHRHCDSRAARNQGRPGRHSAFAPEIFTARPRLSLSLRM